MTRITGRTNPYIIEVAKLRDKKHRNTAGKFLADGIKLFEEADQSGVTFESLILSDSGKDKFYGKYCKLFEKYDIVSVPDTVFEKISEEKSPEGGISVLKGLDKLHKNTTIYNIEENDGVRFILSSIRDPGNLGTMIRSAAAFGISELILSSDCAELYSPKTLRAAMGAVFRQRVTVVKDLVGCIHTLNEAGHKVYAALPDARALPFGKIEGRVCYAVGNEGHGLDADVVEACHGSAYIPMAQGTESLNAAAAATILMYDAGMTRALRG
nr:RNA methyltransferase [Clostridia bacterium]